MRLQILLILGFLLPFGAAAHDFEDVGISRITNERKIIRIYLDNTVKGVRISCAAYDANDELIDAISMRTNALATVVSMVADQEFATPITARCVLN